MRATGKITLSEQDFTFSEPLFRDLRVFDDVTEKAGRPMASVYAMSDLVFACLVSPKLASQDEMEKVITRNDLEAAFKFVMRLGGAKESEGKAESV